MTDTDTPERELIERLRSTGTSLFRPDHPASLLMWKAADTIKVLLSRVDKLEERVRELEDALGEAKLNVEGVIEEAMVVQHRLDEHLNRSAS